MGQLEFFYDQAPDVMRSCSMALQLLSVCIGSYLSGGACVSYEKQRAERVYRGTGSSRKRVCIGSYLSGGARLFS